MKRILYATDGSEAALAGAHLLARLPLEADHQLTLLTVFTDPESGVDEAALVPARQILQETRAAIETRVSRDSSAAEEILRVAAAQPADLVVLGSRGLSGLNRFLIGSTSERVARHARCPVLVARPLVNDLRQVILGIDGSENSMHAADWLKRFPLPEECEVRLVTVMPYLEALAPSRKLQWPAQIQALYQEQCDAAQQELDALVASFAISGTPATGKLRSGHPADSLLRGAEEQKADLIVVGSRGASAIERFLLGSTSEKVLRHAPCSVLMVR
jgi:nucleotide-binding universal stress UspA family protein